MNRKSRLLSPLLRALFLLIAGITIAHADVTIGVGTNFTPADGVRTYMDIGGVWNGSAEVTPTEGDTFSVTYSNTGDDTAYDFTATATLPEGFEFIAGTASVSTNPAADPAITFDATQNGNLLTFDTSGYHLPAGASITFTFDLTTDTTVDPGTFAITHNHSYALTDDGDSIGAVPSNQPVVARAGDTTVNMTPKQQIRAVGETATFTITITNTGLGGIFDLTIDESAIYPEGGNLDFESMVQQLPGDLAASVSGGGSILTLPYLAPGEIFSAEVKAVVQHCGLIENTVSSGHRAASAITENSVPVQIDFRQPMIDYTAPAIPLEYNKPFHVEIPLPNTGLGDARDFELHTTFDELGVTITNVGGGFSYSEGIFTFNANDGTIANGSIDTVLTFDIQATNVCNSSGAGPVSYTAIYTNACGDPYEIPRKFGSVSAAEDAPSIRLSMEVSENRIAVAKDGSYTVNLSARHRENIDDDFVDVFITLPIGVSYSGNTPSTGEVVVNGQELVWSVSVDNLAADQTLEIDFAVDSQPCLAGNILDATATTNIDEPVQSNHACDLTANANVTFLVSNNPGLTASQYFEVTPGDDGTQFLTGDADGSQQGELIRFRATYSFGEAYPGTWTDSVYEDQFNNMGEMTLVNETLTVTGSFGSKLVPLDAITELASGFQIDLGFLANSGYFNEDAVGGHTLTIEYQTTATDDAITTGASMAVAPHLNNLYLAGTDDGSTGICDDDAQDRFTQGVFYTLVRPAASISLSMDNSQIDVCAPEELTITVDNTTVKDAENIHVTLFTAGTDFTYDTGFTPQYGGAFSAGNITYSENGDNNPTFTFTGGALSEEGTITVRVWATTNEIANPLTAKVEYDTWQTADEGNRVFDSDASYTPSVVHKANLAVRVTPGSITVTDSTIRYLTYITNTNSGDAYGTTLTNTLPVGITVDRDATNAANDGAYALDESDVLDLGTQERLIWDLGTIPSGETVQITLVGTVGNVDDCEIPTAGDEIVVTWGCGDSVFQPEPLDSPKFRFPTGQMQILHDTTDSFASLCEDGLIVILLKNTGPTNIQDVTINEVIPAAIGISINGTVRYSVDGEALKTAGDPTPSGDTYTFTSAEIPELAEIVPLGVEGPNLIRIEIPIATADADFAAQTSPSLNVSAEGSIPCGDTVAFPTDGSIGTRFDIPLKRPVIQLTKTGRNITANPAPDAPFTKTVYGGAGDVIEWRIEVENTGTETATHLLLTDALSGSGSVGSSISGGTLIDQIISAETPLELDPLPAESSETYIITEMLGTNCVTLTPEASVTWGCDPGTPVSTPGSPSDSATIVMNPDISTGTDIEQEITYLPGGRARIDVTITNNGGNAHNLVVTNTFPNNNMVLDTSVAPTFVPDPLVADTSAITGMIVDDTTDPLAPEFTFTEDGSKPMLRYGDEVTLIYYVRPTIFDVDDDPDFPALGEAQDGTALDPARPASGENLVEVRYTSGCNDPATSTDTATIDLKSPNLDIVSAPADTVLSTSSPADDLDFLIANVGDSSSVANGIRIVLRVGDGWNAGTPIVTLASGAAIPEVNSSATSGSGFTDYTFTFDNDYALDTSTQIRVRLPNATALNNGESLMLRIDNLTGLALAQDGSVVNGNATYSRDSRATRILGVDLSQTLQSTTESTTTNPEVLIGEEATYLLQAAFFGANGQLNNLTIHATPADSSTGFSHTGLSYISHQLTGNNTLTLNATAPTVADDPESLDESRLEFSASTAPNDGLFEAEVTVRVLNVAENVAGKELRNNFGIRFTYEEKTFGSDDADDGLAGSDVTASTLHAAAAADLQVTRPTVTISKTVRNLGSDGTATPEFAATAGGEADDILEYRIVVTNPNAANAAPLFSISVEDEIPEKMILLSNGAGADTDANETPNSSDAPDINTTGITGGDGADITFNSANTDIENLGSDLARLDPGGSVVLLYRVTLAQSVNPSETLPTSATVIGYSLPAPSGGQTDPKGDQDTVSGAAKIEAAAPATVDVNIIAIDQSKVIQATSEITSDNPAVQIGEQVQYRVTLNLPLGTAPGLSVTDELPIGMNLIGDPVVVIGEDIAAESNLFVADGQNLTWAFGETVADGDDRTITIDYVAQVQNIEENVAGAELTNNAAYKFDEDIIALTARTVTIAEPEVDVSLWVRNTSRGDGTYIEDIAFDHDSAPDAGDIIEFQLRIAVADGENKAGAYDFNIEHTLPEGLTYFAGWTAVNGPDDTDHPSVEPYSVEPGDLNAGTFVGNTLTWGPTSGHNIDIGPGGTFIFHYRATVEETVKPVESYANSVVVDWTSLDGDPSVHQNLGTAHDAPGTELGERNGEGAAPNTYHAELATTVTSRNSTSISKAKSGETLPIETPEEGFRVGDLVTYTLTLDVQEGVLDGFVVQDKLPEGLAFVKTLSITPASDPNGFTFATPVAGSTAPAEEAEVTGTLTWDFGNVVNAGDNTVNDVLEIVYTARILDGEALAVPSTEGETTTQLTNSATVSFKLHNVPESHTTEPATATIDVAQPLLTIEKEVLSPVPAVLDQFVARPGDTVSFRLTATNIGTAPAYNAVLTDLVPEGMRDATPTLTSATLNGTDILDDLTPDWNAGTGTWTFTLANDQFIDFQDSGNTLVLEYNVVLDDDAPKGSTLENSVAINSFFSKPADDTPERRQFGPVDPATAEIVVGLEVTGFVYNDIDPNGTRDDFEKWVEDPDVYVNLVHTATDAVIRSDLVDTDLGNYILTRIPPDEFHIVVATSPTATVGNAPASWIFRSPPDGSRPISLTVVDRHNENFGLYLGVSIAGTVFLDNGIGDDESANDGRRNAGEIGLASVTVHLTNGSGTTYDTVHTTGSGEFQLFVPDTVGPGDALYVQAVPPPNHLTTGGFGKAGDAEFNRAAATLSFEHTPGSSPTDLEIGMVPENAFLSDGQQTILPGATAFYQHTYLVETAGKVVFSISGTANPSIPWAGVLIRDTDGNGLPDAGESVITDVPFTVSAGDEIQLILKESSPSGAPYGARRTAILTATFTYANMTPALESEHTRQDITTIGDAEDAGLQLTKKVDKGTALPGETLTYTITYRNAGTESLLDLIINDRTPHYTVFVSAEPDTGAGSLPNSLTDVQLVAPAENATGPIQWTFTGELDPGASGTVTFSVRLLEIDE